MAVDFSTKATDVNTQIDPAARLVEPPSRQGEIDALNQIGRGIGVGTRTIAQYMQNKGNMDMAKRNAAFSLDLSRLQDAEDQGVSPNEIRIRGRARLQQELANNPNNEEDIMKRYSTWLNQSGYDKIATPAIQQQEINQKQIEAGVSNGFLSANDIRDPQKVKQGLEALENYQKVVTQLEFDQKQISNKKARLDLTAAERTALDKQAEDTATSGLQKVAAAGLPYWRTQYENIKKAAAAATSEQERQQIIKNGLIQLDQDYAQRTAALSGDGLAVNQAKIDQVLLPTKNLIETYKKELSGEYDSESFDRSIKNSQAAIELQTYNNMTPKAKSMVAVSKLFGQAASTVLATKAPAEIANMFAQMDAAAAVGDQTGDSLVNRGVRNKPADVLNGGADDEETTRGYFDTAKKMMKLSADGKIDQDGQNDLNNQLKSVFKSIDVYGNATESAQEFQPVIDFLADPTVGAYLSGGGKVPPEFTGRAQQVIQDGYQTQVIPLLKQELDQTYARPMSEVLPMPGAIAKLTVRVGDIVEPTMETGRFGFKLKAGVEPSREAAAAVKLMNTSAFSKVMNKMIMSNAHMQGNTDYNKSYEQLAPSVLGTGEMGNGDQSSAQPVVGAQVETASLQPVNAEGGALTLQDLMTPPMTTEATPNVTKAASGAFTGDVSQFVNKTDPLEIARSFDGLDEKKDAQVISSFIKKAAGININPATTAWCAAFVNAVLGASGGEGTGRLNARSFLDWGQPVDKPSEGDVVVFERGGKNSWQGHVGFYAGEEMKGGERYIRVLSGNQSNGVNETLYSAKRLLGVRRAT